jgi:ComF family protein
MHNIKYFDKKRLAFDLGAMFSSLIPDSVFNGIDGITAVPLHWYRKQKRGYNQAEWLARGFLSSRKEVKYFDGILLRKHHTKTQTKLAKEQRKKNISKAFVVPKNRGDLIKGKSLILVDDVITTGSTTAACAEVLLKAGAQSVRVLSLARD